MLIHPNLSVKARRVKAASCLGVCFAGPKWLWNGRVRPSNLGRVASVSRLLLDLLEKKTDTSVYVHVTRALAFAIDLFRRVERGHCTHSWEFVALGSKLSCVSTSCAMALCNISDILPFRVS